MADERIETVEFSAIQIAVKSKILERITEVIRRNKDLVASTMYTKSDGTNYGMYQKSDDITSLGDIWEQVFNPAARISAKTQFDVAGPNIGKTAK